MLDAVYSYALEPFIEYGFMRRALVGSLALSLGATPVGTFLLLRRLSLTGEAIACAILPGVAFAFLAVGLSITAMTLGGLLAGLLVALLSGTVARKTILEEDASLASLYLISLATGVLIISSKGSSVDLLHILFGSVLAFDNTSILLTGITATVSLITLATIYRALVLECVDPAFLRTVSRSSAYTHHLFLMLVVINLVAGLQSLGTLMSIGIMVLPAATARLWANEVSKMIAIALAVACIGCYLGLVISYHLNVSSGAVIVLTIGFIYLASLVVGKQSSLVVHLTKPRHLTG